MLKWKHFNNENDVIFVIGKQHSRMKNKTTINHSIISLISSIIIALSGCSSDRFSNIETQKVDLKIVRFEKELFNLNIYSFFDSIDFLHTKYADFMSLFGNKIIEIGDPSQAWFKSALHSFVTDQAVYNINNRVAEVFPELNALEYELSDAFGKWSTVFPNKPIPVIYTYVSGFNQSIVTTENILGISLEKYLGTEEELYNQVYPPLPNYQRYSMTPEKMPSDIIRAWATTEIEYSPEQNNLLSQMIYNGQIMYLTNKLLPSTHDTLLWGFTPKQLKFCINNEKQMWTYLIEQKLLFSTDNFKIGQFINESPFTKDFTNESPGRAAVWIGFRIVEKYAKKMKDLELSHIVTEKNYQKILTQSRYRP